MRIINKLTYEGQPDGAVIDCNADESLEWRMHYLIQAQLDDWFAFTRDFEDGMLYSRFVPEAFKSAVKRLLEAV